MDTKEISLKCKSVHTSISVKDEAFTVTFYNTEIVKYWPENGFVSLNTGGFQTYATIKRINEVLPTIGIEGSVFQKNKKMYMVLKINRSKIIIPFVNGVCEFNRFTGERSA